MAKRPTRPEWLAADSLPPLPAEEIDELFAQQSRLKEIAASPAATAFIERVGRAKCGDLALAVLRGWLASSQEVKDRWALAIAGALGDSRVLPLLASAIPKWCEGSRHKLAEYAAQAIALQGSDESLMLLDSYATRYRNRFRNVGAAAAAAFRGAAAARGISEDELGDLVVPRFDFDADGVRVWSWEDGSIEAVLGNDLKLGWRAHAEAPVRKSPPANLPVSVRAEAKDLAKLLREAAKAQSLRLEQALVRQRRWPVARWRELFEEHPLLRTFASRLVWRAHGGDGSPTFRRYENGLLANARGALVDLDQGFTGIDLAHPLDLDPAELQEWRAHFERMKVSAPFPQLDRAVERLEPAHVNRRELMVVDKRTISNGTFRSRAEKLGWVRSCVADAGSVLGYYKLFAGANVEACLEIDGMYIGSDPTEALTLGPARFVPAGSVNHSGYAYDEPKSDDPRLLPFGKLPPVVYSETVGDLKVIAGASGAS